ncbi:MAG TPA: farnesyl diphosphate synthase [Gemmatimonadaceae bacterium]|jgi:geranylgeranyl pyrophosphate synthase|nr:farnesyl diphosphate synthase [Gemmatimonadaceae bacterium]
MSSIGVSERAPLSIDWRAQRSAIDRELSSLCDRHANDLGPQLIEAVRYALLGGGKRLRGLLLLAAYRAAGGTADASALAASIEVVHAYSLIHDDLPCMDDDDIRRGRPTAHRAFGVRTATVAGVAMVPVAALSAFRAARELGLSDEQSANVAGELMHASGAGGMIGGQLLDLDAEGSDPPVEDLERIHRAKTGALIRAAAVIGGMAAQALPAKLDALAEYGDSIGLAFQIADDVLDVTATTDRLGKTAGRDLDLAKGTYPRALGVAGAERRAGELVEQACRALRHEGLLNEELDALAHFAVERAS